MTFSPHGSTAVAEGSLRKGLPIMMLAGVLAWVSGQSWSSGRSSDGIFEFAMAFATLATMAVPAQLIAGPRARPWLMATVGAFGLGVPWLFGLAFERGGQGVFVPTAIVVAIGWVLIYAMTWATRRAMRRTLRQRVIPA